MNLFKYIKNYVFEHNYTEKETNVVSNPDVLQQIINYEEEVSFVSDTITGISENSFLDTTSSLAIAKYKNNLRLLTLEAKTKGKVDQFRIIRDDDFFPNDWEWRVGSQNTNLEIERTIISFALKQMIAYRNMGLDFKSDFLIPVSEEKLNAEIAKLDANLGAILSPVRFRSTKHFTVNTPLSYTGEYNSVEAGRMFTVIDTMDNFLSSGYAYTADYRDAYLDVTHESLKISERAIVLIAKDKYQSVINNPEIAKQLQDRKVIIYCGDEAVAINMVLSENGVLPARPGNKYMIYDNDIRDILENSMKDLCASYNIQYAKGHGNLFGKGGHFTDLYDGYNHDYESSRENFLAFLLQTFPQAKGKINSNVLRDINAAEELVKLVGIEPLLSAIENYNQITQLEFNKNYQKYKDDRSSITTEISQIFQKTVKFIDDFYLNEYENTLSFENNQYFKKIVRLFFHSNTVDEQLLAANQISQMFGLNFQTDNVQHDEFSI